jgi:anaerobic magnesium-protoporphyrin IX monomethyl ester cyclase
MDLHKFISRKNRDIINIDGLIDIILAQVQFVPDFIGISISFSNGHKVCLQLCRQRKEKWLGSTIIAGGVHATTFSHRLITESAIDYIIRGAGDVAFVDLLQCLVDGSPLDYISGVVTGTSNVDSMASPLDNLDKIPPYPYDLIDMDYLVDNESTNPVYEKGTKTGIIFMSRGCPYGCSFCAADKVHGNKPRFKSVDRMVDEVEYLIKKYHVNTINIIDDLFGAEKQYFYDFFRKINERGLKFMLAIPGGLSIRVFNEDMIDVLVENGLHAVYFPLESGSEYVQNNIIKKRVDLNKAVRLIHYSKQRGCLLVLISFWVRQVKPRT